MMGTTVSFNSLFIMIWASVETVLQSLNSFKVLLNIGNQQIYISGYKTLIIRTG